MMAQLILNNNSAAQFICYEKAILFNNEFGSRHIFSRRLQNAIAAMSLALLWLPTTGLNV